MKNNKEISEKKKLSVWAIGGIIASALIGFGIAKITSPKTDPQTKIAETANNNQSENVVEKTASSEINLSEDGIKSSQIETITVQNGDVSDIINATATAQANSNSTALLTAPTNGIITRILKNVGDDIGAGETIAIVESNVASTIPSDKSSALARLNLAKKQLERERILLNQGVSPRADYEVAEANLALANSELMRIDAIARASKVIGDGRNASIKSPISGKITSINANLGQFVSAEAELFRVTNPRNLQIIANIPPNDAPKLNIGNRVELNYGANQYVIGWVKSFTGSLDPNTRATSVIIQSDDAAQNLIIGQIVNARIFTNSSNQSSNVIVPEDAVQTVGGQNVIFIRTENGFKSQLVKTANRSGGMITISSGLKAGDQIASKNAFLLKSEIEKETAE